MQNLEAHHKTNLETPENAACHLILGTQETENHPEMSDEVPRLTQEINPGIPGALHLQNKDLALPVVHGILVETKALQGPHLMVASQDLLNHPSSNGDLTKEGLLQGVLKVSIHPKGPLDRAVTSLHRIKKRLP